VELDEAWGALAFQAQGHAHQLTALDASTVLVALSAGGVLARYADASRALVAVLRNFAGALSARRLIKVWAALDRADVIGSDVSCTASFEGAQRSASEQNDAAAFLQAELVRALPADVEDSAEESASPKSVLRGADHEWRRMLALLAASDCRPEQLRPRWEALEAAVLADGASLCALSVGGLISAARTAVLARQRTGVAPAERLAGQIKERIVSQARWMDGWSTSHAVLALAQLGAKPQQGYDPLRQGLLERCALSPSRVQSRPAHASEAAPGATNTRHGRRPKFGVAEESDSWSEQQLAESERVAAALARFDVHDADVRSRLAAWLLKPLPVRRLARLALDLASIGLCDAADPKVARHVRAFARSSELRNALGTEGMAALLEAYKRESE